MWYDLSVAIPHDPLAALVVDEDSIAREELAAGLASYVQLTKEGGIWPLPAFEALTSADKVLCLLLAFRAMSMLDLRENDRVGPAELVEMSGMPPGTVRPKLSKLVEKRLVVRDKREYWISNPGARKALEVLRDANG
jgi:hypothetical protein